MTNLEWLHSLSVDEVLSFFGGYTSKCHMCGYKDACTDNTAKCYRFPIGLNIWLMQEHKDELKPCPFCGAEVDFMNHDSNVFWVQCRNCGSHGMQSRTKRAAIEAWNRRV